MIIRCPHCEKQFDTEEKPTPQPLLMPECEKWMNEADYKDALSWADYRREEHQALARDVLRLVAEAIEKSERAWVEDSMQQDSWAGHLKAELRRLAGGK